MADLTIGPAEVKAALSNLFENFKPTTTQQEVGRVIQAGDGIARVVGLPNVVANEMLEFPGDLVGLALNLEPEQLGVVILGDANAVEEGMPVSQTHNVLSIPVGDAYLGRAVDALGNPIDGKGPLDKSKIDGTRELELQAASVINRQPVTEPLQTGIKAIDAMIPIGRGQRELLIGDRQTGKTAVAIDTIVNQKQYWGTEKAVKCIYVAIGQKNSTVAEVLNGLQQAGAMEYTTVVNAPASAPGAFKYLAPYSGCAIGQHWMYKGEHVLIIYDDLSKQADAYRQISLLLRRPPGREAYPGDVFYLHSRLLERSAKLSDELGGGSLTALPVIETKEGDLSAYIPTNVISITDGQIFFETDLFYQGFRPAINVGTSVSRVGGAAQIKAIKKIAGPLKIELAQYRELAAFAGFGSDLDKASQAQLNRGARLTELLKQSQFSPIPVEEQCVSIYAGSNKYLDDIPMEDVVRFDKELREYVGVRAPEVYEHIRTKGDFPDEIEQALRKAIEDFTTRFTSGEATLPEAPAGGTTAQAPEVAAPVEEAEMTGDTAASVTTAAADQP
ncbi:MAG TPA: F0F1 ATP synthase subunit alpha [Actinomycetota bacterium]|nr:F0F1 ATP synthase subunit alpha [Actinomycetota bacterium]